MAEEKLSRQKCVPCEGGMSPFTEEEVKSYLIQLGADSGWYLEDEKSILRSFEFYGGSDWNSKWQKGAEFVGKIAQVAGEQDHHPTFINLRAMRNGGLVEVKFSTHVIGGLSKNDFIMAAKLNEIFAKF